MADKRKIVAAGTIKGGVVTWIKSREQYDHHVKDWEWFLFGSLRWLRRLGTSELRC
jgi:hypothetical protein